MIIINNDNNNNKNGAYKVLTPKVSKRYNNNDTNDKQLWHIIAKAKKCE